MKSSLFIHHVQSRYVHKKIEIIYASTFMSVLAALIHEKAESSIVLAFKNIIGRSGLGYFVEYMAHRAILDSSKDWYAVSMEDNRTILSLPFSSLHRYYIIDIADIANLQSNCYALPSMPNFPLIDAIVRVLNTYYLLQMTIAKYHDSSAAAKNLKQIIEACRKHSPESKIVFIWILVGDNFNAFSEHKFIEDAKLQQYKTKTCYQTSENLLSAISKKRKVSLSIF